MKNLILVCWWKVCSQNKSNISLGRLYGEIDLLNKIAKSDKTSQADKERIEQIVKKKIKYILYLFNSKN